MIRILPRRALSALATLVPAMLVLSGSAAPAGAQSLADRVAGAGDGSITFNFTAPAGVCGDGRSYMAIGTGTIIGSWVGSGSPAERGDCAPGPVRVRLTRAGGMVVHLATAVGPADTTLTRDLGMVRNEDAAAFLLDLARRAEGAPARDAIMPAALAGGHGAWRSMLAIGRDDARPTEVRRSAVSWTGRLAAPSFGGPPTEIASALTALAEDGTQLRPIREAALSAIARFDEGAGVPSLQRLTRVNDAWLAERATTQLARSGDPRSRETLRVLARDPRAAIGVRVAAVRGIARSFTTGDDARWLRESWAAIPDETVRRAILDGVRESGGPEQARWLLGIARGSDTPLALRRRALTQAAALDVSSSDLVALWAQTDEARLRDDLLAIYARRADQPSIDHLLMVVRDTSDAQLRRRAINRLSTIDDPRVAAELRRIIGG